MCSVKLFHFFYSLVRERCFAEIIMQNLISTEFILRERALVYGLQRVEPEFSSGCPDHCRSSAGTLIILPFSCRRVWLHVQPFESLLYLVRIGVAGRNWSVWCVYSMTQAVAAVAVTAVSVKSSVSGVEAGGGCVGDSREKNDLRYNNAFLRFKTIYFYT